MGVVAIVIGLILAFKVFITFKYSNANKSFDFNFSSNNAFENAVG